MLIFVAIWTFGLALDNLLPVLSAKAAPAQVPDSRFACNPFPIQTRAWPALVLIGLFVAFWLYRSQRREHAAVDEPKFDGLLHIAPAWTALGTATGFLCVLLVTGYFAPVRQIVGLGGLNDSGSAAAHVAANKAIDELFELSKEGPGTHLPSDSGALLLWASMYALTIGAVVLALWVSAGILAQSRARRHRLKVVCSVVALALTISIAVFGIGLGDPRAGFGGIVGSTMLCGTWQRLLGTSPQTLAMLSDALNVVGFAAPIVVVLGACLLLDVVGRSVYQVEKPQVVLGEIAHASGQLDKLLYAGAAALVAGTLQVSALYALAIAHFPTVSDVKVKREICRVQSSEPAAIQLALASSEVCKNIGAELRMSDASTPLRKFARSLTLAFGLGFSALLGAIYLGAATLLTSRAEQLVGLGLDGDETAGRLRLMDLGIESNLLGKLGRLATTLSPLAAGLVSNFLGSSG